jgi:hypothetical protein
MDSTRRITESGMDVELVVYGRMDGRWEAHVASWRALDLSSTADLTTNWHAALWPSVNGPTAEVALDALEAELREWIGATADALGTAAPRWS